MKTAKEMRDIVFKRARKAEVTLSRARAVKTGHEQYYYECEMIMDEYIDLMARLLILDEYTQKYYQREIKDEDNTIGSV